MAKAKSLETAFEELDALAAKMLSLQQHHRAYVPLL